MSSPFHQLKRNRVPLFPGHMTGNRPIPFRHPEYSEDECRLLEEITTQMVQDRRKRSPFVGLSPLSSSPNKLHQKKIDTSPTGTSPERRVDKTSPPSDSELMRMMMTRITFLEQQNQTQQNELRVKERQIKILEDKLRIAEKSRKEKDNSSDVKDLETHCLLLQQQVHEMETFLAEYGMVWVGEQGNENADVYLEDDDVDEENNNLTETVRSESPGNSIASSNLFGFWQQDRSLPDPDVPFRIDFNQLIENIQDLNVLAGEGVAQIKKTADGARFEIPEPVQLRIYANGIIMFDGPFRPYTDPTTWQCVQDLLDGYFPSELQRRYPDGVPFIVTDLREKHFQPKQSPLAFAGEGQALGGEVRLSCLIPANPQDASNKIPLPSMGTASQTSTGDQEKESVKRTSRLQGKPMTQAQFLNKLPRSIIKDGKVIDIRDSIGKTLTGHDGHKDSSLPTVTLVSTSVTKEMSESIAASDPAIERPRSYKGHSDVTTLRVIRENGAHTYIVKMKFSETIGNLRTYLDMQQRPTVPYDIVSTFPHKVHKNNTMTLEASGLTPNAVIHLKPYKQ